MVTTNSLTPDLVFHVNVLEQSGLPEDQLIAAKAREQLAALVKVLLPVLSYVDRVQFNDVRGIVVVDLDPKLLLLRNGEWLTFGKNRAVHRQGVTVWEGYCFLHIIEGLKKAFDDAMAKKEEHLKAIARRTELLDGIGEMIASKNK